MKKIISDERLAAIIGAAQAYAYTRHSREVFAGFTETEVCNGLACALISRDAILRTDRSERGAAWDTDLYKMFERAGLTNGNWERTLQVYDTIVHAWCGGLHL